VGSVRRPNEVLPGEQACSLSPIVTARYSGNNAPTRCICSIRCAVSACCLPSRVFLYLAFISDFKSGHCRLALIALTESTLALNPRGKEQSVFQVPLSPFCTNCVISKESRSYPNVNSCWIIIGMVRRTFFSLRKQISSCNRGWPEFGLSRRNTGMFAVARGSKRQ
jgi:hypothetical protein